MFTFNIVQSTSDGERAYYINQVRFNRDTWRKCMEHEIRCAEQDVVSLELIVAGYDIAIKAAQALMDGEANFEACENYREFYRQVLSELREYKRQCRYEIEAAKAHIEDLTDKLED